MVIVDVAVQAMIADITAATAARMGYDLLLWLSRSYEGCGMKVQLIMFIFFFLFFYD